MEGQSKRRLGAEAQEAIRIRLIHYLEGGKGTQQEAAEVFMLSVAAVKKIWKRYNEQGMDAIKAHPRGRQPGSGQLSTRKAAVVTKAIIKAMPQQYGLPYTLWTALAVRELIKKRPG